MSLMALILATAGLQAKSSQDFRLAHANTRGPVTSGRTVIFSKTITEVGVTPEDAEKLAVRKAREELITFLQQQEPPVGWQPTTADVERFIPDTSKKPREIDGKSRDLGLRSEMTLTVQLTAAEYTGILQTEQKHITEARHWLLAKIVAGLVALLGTIAVYFRLDEWTKGYYTTWLRMAAGMFLSAVLGGLLLLS
jgi:hypothetical protein